jgi:hypothetical protein
MKYNSFTHGEMTLVGNGRVSTQRAFRVGEIRGKSNVILTSHQVSPNM